MREGINCTLDIYRSYCNSVFSSVSVEAFEDNLVVLQFETGYPKYSRYSNWTFLNSEKKLNVSSVSEVAFEVVP